MIDLRHHLALIWDTLYLDDVIPYSIGILLAAIPCAARWGWISLPPWVLCAFAGVTSVFIVSSGLSVLKAKRANIAEMQAESFHIPFMTQIVAEEHLRTEELASAHRPACLDATKDARYD